MNYQRLFEAIPGAYLVLTTDLTIVAVSNAYLEATMARREDLFGKSLFDAFPDNPDDPNADGVVNLHHSLQRAMIHRQPDAMPVQKYDIRLPESQGGGFETRYWSPINSPVFDDRGRVIYLIHRVEDVTEFIQSRMQEQSDYDPHHILEGKEVVEANLMARARAIVDLNRKLTTTNQLLQVEIAERLGAEQRLKVLNQALADAKAAADAASTAKSTFLATMSHEIRTPLNGVMGMLELIAGTPLNDKQQQYANLARLSAESLIAIINDILDFSKIEAGKLELAPVEFNLHHAVEDVMTMLAQAAMQKGLEIACHIAPDVPADVRADDSRLRQVLINLVNNAIKFTPTGSVVVRVTLEKPADDAPGSPATIRLSVTDTGIGITPDQQDRLFQAFIQADTSTTRNYGGTGLGLAISRELVALMNGQIGVVSEPGLGSTFWFTLEVEPRPVQDQPTALRNRLDPATLRILVVDDSEIQRDVLCQQIQSWGVKACGAADGQHALRLLDQAARRDAPYKVALVDKDMPDMDGVAFAAAVRSQPNIRQTVLMILLSMESNMDPHELRRMGFSGQMTKPVRQSQLFDAIMNSIAANHLHPAPEPVVTEAATSAAPPPTIQGPCHLLVVEDNEINRIVAQEVLTRFGCTSDAVPGGLLALEAVSQTHYDAILMDCHMPGMDGLEATRQIRRMEQDKLTHGRDGRRIPIIALTANAMEGKQEDCFAAGMDAYTRKPINIRHLMETIESVLPESSVDLPTQEAGLTAGQPALSDDPTPENASSNGVSSGVSSNGLTDAEHPDEGETSADHETPVAAAQDAPPADPQGSSPVDVSILMSQCMDQRQLAMLLLEKLQHQLAHDRQTFDAFLRQWNAEQAAQAAHALKGAAGAVGATSLRDAAARVESIARQRRKSQAPEALAQLQEQIARCTAYIPAVQVVLGQPDPTADPAADDPAR